MDPLPYFTIDRLKELCEYQRRKQLEYGLEKVMFSLKRPHIAPSQFPLADLEIRSEIQRLGILITLIQTTPLYPALAKIVSRLYI